VFGIGAGPPDLSDTGDNDDTIKRTCRPPASNPSSATWTTAPEPVEINAEDRIMPRVESSGLTGAVIADGFSA